METIWFCLITMTLAAYVVLDGFDLGAGVLHLSVAHTDRERRIVLRSIGPLWDGNEVWLLAAARIMVGPPTSTLSIAWSSVMSELETVSRNG